MNNNNNNNLDTDPKNKYGGAMPFVVIFGGLTLALILIKLLMNLFAE